jgi:PrtD family type I secretion system ABC transporter
MNVFLRHCRRHFLFAGLFSLVVNVLQLTVPLYMLQVFERVLTSRSHETLLALSIAALGALVVHLLLDLLRSRLLLAAGVSIDGLASPAVLSRLLNHIARIAKRAASAELKDVSTLRGFLSGPGIVALFDAPWAPVYLAVIFLFHPQLGWIATVGTAALLGFAYLNEKLTRQPIRETNAAARLAASVIDGGMCNAEVVNVLGMSQTLQRRWQQRNEQVIDAHVRATGRGNLVAGLTKFTRLLIQVAMLAAGAVLVIDEQATAGVMITATLILARALAPAESAIGTWRAFVDARESYRRLEVLLASSSGEILSTRLPTPEGRLVADRVTFAPHGSQTLLLKSVSFALEAGESLGLIGPSGSGKSTLARVLTGWWRPASGAVRLDGADVASWAREELGPHLGYLPQDVQLFDGTVAENIARLGNASSETIVAAAKRAHAHEMILQLPDGYDTVIGAGGVALSGGQRQRIALARALFGDPRLVVLDEPNANLDTEGEQTLLGAMRDLKLAGVTTIVISHRPSVLAEVDKLLVLSTGRVECFGPRAEVMAHVIAPSRPRAHLVPQLVVGGAA